MPITLVTPSAEHLASYEDALLRGYAPSSSRPQQRDEHLAALRDDPESFLATQDDPEGRGPPVTLGDGTQVPRLPGIVRWIWDGAFGGSISLRWQHGTAELPPQILGHIGYGVVPWRRRQGYATRALALMLPEARRLGLPYVELTTDPDNLASHRVIEGNGGLLVERFHKPAAWGGGESLRWRIPL